MHKYDWAVNKAKLTQSVMAVEAKKKLDVRVSVDEETIKLEYIARGGLLTTYKPTIVEGKVVRPAKPSIEEQEADVKAEKNKPEESEEAIVEDEPKPVTKKGKK